MKKTFTSLFFALALALCGAAQGILTDQYGICCGATSGDDLSKHRKIFSGISSLGLNWTRCDFVWRECNPEKGVWDCQHLDQVLSSARKSGVNVLPILCYDVRWAKPAVEHLYEWGDYVREMVSRYGKQLRYWEVYNEPNLKYFWRRNPSGAEYAALLQKAYNVIKSIDPGIKVVFGGLSGVPLDYVEDALKAGAGECFDVMNIHPYHLRDVPEAIIPQITKLRDVMTKYGVGDKPIWITEIGWSTCEPFKPFDAAVEAAYDYLGIEKGRYPLVCVRDRRYGESRYVNQNPALSDRFTGELEINMDVISSVDPANFPVMFPARGEKFPVKYIPALLEYLKKGGTLLFNNGSPLAYDLQLQSDGTVKQVNIGRKYYKDFHIQLEYNWANVMYPKAETWQAPSGLFKDKIFTDFKEGGRNLISKPCSRFLTEDCLKGGDKLVPLINGGTDSFSGCIAGIYQLDSDLKGNIIVVTSGAGDAGVSQQRQAAFLPRAYLTAFALGLERVFWFNYREPDGDIADVKSHYGIVANNLAPKPSLSSLKTLVSMLPSGSTRPVMSLHKGIYTAHWQNPSGKDVWACWCELDSCAVTLDWEGNLEAGLNYLGEEMPVSKGECKVSEGCTYLVGPTKLSINKL